MNSNKCKTREELLEKTFKLLRQSMNLNNKMLREQKINFLISILLHIVWFLLGMFWGIRLWC